MRFLPHIWAMRRMNCRAMCFFCMDEGPSGLVLALCCAAGTGSCDTAPVSPGQGRGTCWLCPAPQTHGGCPSPSSAASLDILKVDAAVCWGEMLFQRVLWVQSQGKDRGGDGDRDVFPSEQRVKKKTTWNIRLLFQCVVDMGNQKDLIVMIQYLNRIHQV